jgi:carbonic anhydrase/acetyltransferase-like protein (isoleucine patch superfamily)
VVLPGTEVPPGSLVAGVPAKVRRPLTEEERASIRANADGYLLLADAHRGAEPVRPRA